MKKAILYAAAAFSLMTGATSCSDFGDVNNDPEQMTPAILDFKLVFTQVMSQACGSDWDVWRNGMIYSACMLQHTTSVTWDYGTFMPIQMDTMLPTGMDFIVETEQPSVMPTW